MNFFALSKTCLHILKTRGDRMLLLTIPKNTQYAYDSRVLEKKNKNEKKRKTEEEKKKRNR